MIYIEFKASRTNGRIEDSPQQVLRETERKLSINDTELMPHASFREISALIMQALVGELIDTLFDLGLPSDDPPERPGRYVCLVDTRQRVVVVSGEGMVYDKILQEEFPMRDFCSRYSPLQWKRIS